MKKIIFVTAPILIIIVSAFFVISNKNTIGIKGSYESIGNENTIQLVFNEGEYKEYVDSKLMNSGFYKVSKGNSYLLTSKNQTLFLYRNGKILYYYNPSISDTVIELKKFSKTPTYVE